MKVLLTGATGFIGSNLYSSLISQGVEVIPVARKERQDMPMGNLVTCDLAKEFSLAEPVDIILHAAAQSPAPGITTAQFVRSNIDAVRRLIYYAKQYKVTRFIFFSSISLYGKVNVPVVDENSPITDPTTYGMTKKLGELLLSDESAWLSCIALRLPGVVGKGAVTPWITRIARSFKNNQDVDIYNPTAMFNNMVHIEDLNSFIWHLLTTDWQGFRPLTLACDEPLTIRHSVGIVREQLHSASRITEQYTEKMSFTISNNHARGLGFKPKRTVEVLENFAAFL
jgi:nucleoside-diphosphate-sugar epimerase